MKTKIRTYLRRTKKGKCLVKTHMRKTKKQKKNHGSTDVFNPDGFAFRIPTGTEGKIGNTDVDIGESLIINPKGDIINTNPRIFQGNRKSYNTRLSDKYGITDYGKN